MITISPPRLEKIVIHTRTPGESPRTARGFDRRRGASRARRALRAAPLLLPRVDMAPGLRCRGSHQALLWIWRPPRWRADPPPPARRSRATLGWRVGPSAGGD